MKESRSPKKMCLENILPDQDLWYGLAGALAPYDYFSTLYPESEILLKSGVRSVTGSDLGKIGVQLLSTIIGLQFFPFHTPSHYGSRLDQNQNFSYLLWSVNANSQSGPTSLALFPFRYHRAHVVSQHPPTGCIIQRLFEITLVKLFSSTLLRCLHVAFLLVLHRTHIIKASSRPLPFRSSSNNLPILSLPPLFKSFHPFLTTSILLIHPFLSFANL